MSPSSIELPSKLSGLFESHRYKILYGGRGGAKSWGIARALLIKAMQGPIRVLCCREFQNSIQDSAHRLLSDQIKALGFEDFFEIQRTKILGRNGSEFGFEGLRHNITSIKSWEGADIAWVEEATPVSKASWDVLIPTIRKPGSEIWVSFNPELETDETYKRFVLTPPPNALVLRLNWSDNPWFPAVLREELETLKARDHDAYLNVWEGHCKQMLEGAVYAKELRAAQEEGRIGRIAYDATIPVHTFWDLGWADNTSIWFAQVVRGEYRLIDYLEDSQKPLQHYIKALQAKPYIYAKHWLPHDAQAKSLGSGRSVEELAKAAGLPVQITPRLSLADGINAARTVFGQCWFDETKCADGLNALRHYRYERNEDMGTWKNEPLHDWASHGADAFRYLALSLKESPKPKPKVAARVSGSWMG